jgi:hypothetical protein
VKLLEGVEIINNLPAIYIKSIDAVVLADMHLGYEDLAAEGGVFIPKTQFKEEARMMKKILEKTKAKKIIIDGDVKNEFSPKTFHEFKEVEQMLKLLKENFERVILIKGNHDNYIYYATSKIGAELYDELLISDYFFVHGHKSLALKQLKARIIVIGHEHPVIGLYDEVGGKEVVKCFLVGKSRFGQKILVLPAFSTLSYGTEMNAVTRDELLSPLLKEVDLNEFNVFGVDEEVGILKLGKIKDIRF